MEKLKVEKVLKGNFFILWQLFMRNVLNEASQFDKDLLATLALLCKRACDFHDNALPHEKIKMHTTLFIEK